MEHMQIIEQFNTLINNIINRVTLQILIMERDTGAMLKTNEAAMAKMLDDFEYMGKLTEALSHHDVSKSGAQFELNFESNGQELTLLVMGHALPWEDKDALLYTIDDVSEATKEIKELENFAYHDSLTNLHNRTYGMRILNKWLDEKREFVLLFADLDRLKYINDVFGHEEGDKYIISAGNHLRAFPKGAIICRLGGDEYMALIPNMTEDEATQKAAAIATALETDKYLADKEFTYGMSYGCVGVTKTNTSPAKTILSTADEKMYVHKRARKAERRD
ncbi:MAG: GGDEF domain-containing protein [Defluviitaleaceae bacterium]|nr:GGDEF domain-containing protein [Defluviitaleaceae bacterium]MCL2263943.1 GGDEF domain-containing protein [Defluviitaleaceae bacterium]